MGVGLIDEHERNSLASFLRRREAKNACVELFAGIHQKHEPKRSELTKAKSPSYQLIVESFDTCLSRNWLTYSELADFLAALETAGRQHVMLFHLSARKAAELNEALKQPRNPGSEDDLAAFWDPPAAPFSRVVWSGAQGTLTKIVTKRKYESRSKPQADQGNRQVIIVEEREERSAVIFKLLKPLGLLQVRIPVLEDGPDETPKTLWTLLENVVHEHFTPELFGHFQVFPLSDAFQPILRNFDDFVLTKEQEDDGDCYGTRGRRRSINGDILDLRLKEGWTNNGRPRLRLDGAWKIGEVKRDEGEEVEVRMIDCRMHFEQLRINASTSKIFARVFIPQPCTDQEMDHVIHRIHGHIPNGA